MRMVIALLAVAGCRAGAPAQPVAAPAPTAVQPVEELASIRGVVRSETGGALERMTLLVLDGEARWVAATVTDEEGRYHVGGLPSGDYRLVAFNRDVVAERTAHLQGADLSDLDLAIDARSRRVALIVIKGRCPSGVPCRQGRVRVVCGPRPSPTVDHAMRCVDQRPHQLRR